MVKFLWIKTVRCTEAHTAELPQYHNLLPYTSFHMQLVRSISS